jgi:hypothetical protein
VNNRDWPAAELDWTNRRACRVITPFHETAPKNMSGTP